MLYKSIRYSFFFLLLALLAACSSGGGGSDDSGDTSKPELSGVFIDSPIQGLRFESSPSGKNGFTDANGTFLYEEGDTVSFFIGSILVGSAAGDSLLTPVSLVSGAADTSNTEVLNIARFLQSLDEDSNPNTDGISITSAVHDAASGLSLDFSSTNANFESEADALVQSLRTAAYGDTNGLIDSSVALIHLNGAINSAMQTALVGTYQGSFTGDDSGTWEFVIDEFGVITGQSTSLTNGESLVSAYIDLTSGEISGLLRGSVSPAGGVSGFWGDPLTDSGVFSGARTSSTYECNADTIQYGCLTMSGTDSDTIGIHFNPNDYSLLDPGDPAVEGTHIRWRIVTPDGMGGGNIPAALLVERFSDGSVAAVSLTWEMGTNPVYAYQIDCSVEDCGAIVVNDAEQTATFSGLQLPNITAEGGSSSTAPITLNGALNTHGFVPSGGGGGGGNPPSGNTSLVGVWLDDCTIDTGSGQDIARQFYISFNQDGIFEQEIREVEGLVCGRAANTSTGIGTYTLGADVVLTSGNTAKQIERIITAYVNNGVTTPLSQPLMLRGLVYVDGDTSWWNFSLQNDTAYPTDMDLNASIIFYRQP